MSLESDVRRQMEQAAAECASGSDCDGAALGISTARIRKLYKADAAYQKRKDRTDRMRKRAEKKRDVSARYHQ